MSISSMFHHASDFKLKMDWSSITGHDPYPTITISFETRAGEDDDPITVSISIFNADEISIDQVEEYKMLTTVEDGHITNKFILSEEASSYPILDAKKSEPGHPVYVRED
jgi:hypothetical protein